MNSLSKTDIFFAEDCIIMKFLRRPGWRSQVRDRV